MPMRISLSTGTYYHLPLSYSLHLARELGFDGVEWVVSPGYLLNGLDPVRKAFAEAGVRPLSVHPPFYPLPGWPRRPTRRMARLGALARMLGAELFVVHTALFGSYQSRRAEVYGEALARGRLAGGPRVEIGVETGQYNERTRRYPLDDLETLVRYCRERDCGITFDTCHVGANEEDLLASYAIVRPLMRNVHLSDVEWRAGRPHTHRLPGEGNLPLGELLETMARDGYDGLVTLEIHPETAGPFSRRQATRRLAKALEFVRAHIAADASGAPTGSSGDCMSGEASHAAEE
jgi:sugar phosphate isomerase/epimerase